MDLSWMDRARCASMGPRWFFGETAEDAGVAKTICLRCPVMGACANYALTNKIEHGVWGATSARDRRKILKQRRLARLEKVS